MPLAGGTAASSAVGRSIRTFPWSRLGVRPGWLFWMTFLLMAAPLGFLPAANGASIVTHAIAPAPSADHGSPVASPISALSGPEIIPGSTGPAGPLVTPTSLSIRPPVGNSTSGSSSPPTVTSAMRIGAPAKTLGLSGILQALKNRTDGHIAASPAVYQTPIGWFTGYVNDSTDLNGIPGMYLQVYSPSLCSSNRCPTTLTNLTGYFNITCPAAGGPGSNDAIILTTNNWYFDNVSYDACVANQTRYVGTIYLVRDGVGIGFVKDQVSGKPIVGAQVYAITRDGSIIGYPTVYTGTNGSFQIGLPPVPAKVYIVPPTGYEATFNFTNATPGTGNRPNVPPWYGGINMGTFWLVHQTLVVAHLVNSQTNTTISSDPLGGNAMSALQACDAFGGGCNTQGQGVLGSATVRAFANPGWNYFEAYSDGFVMTATKAQLIPILSPGQTFNIGPIYMTELGEFSLKDAFTVTDGGTPAWKAPNSGVGSIYASVCSDDGYQTSFYIPSGTYFSSSFNMSSNACVSEGCWNLGNSPTLSAPPLRVFVTVTPDTTGYCYPGSPQWPVPANDPPVWNNFTFVNVTSAHSVPGTVWVNLTIGDYIAGRIAVTGTNTIPSNVPYIVAVSSEDNNYWNSESYNYNTQTATGNYLPCASILRQTVGSFCIPVPPGNSKITITSPGYASNWTWVHTPDYCCQVPLGGPGWPTTLNATTTDHEQVINITPDTGLVWGDAIIEGTSSTPVPIFSVQVCPTSAASSAGCGNGLGINGTFYGVQSPIGTDQVTVAAPGYASNSAWINVSAGGNTSVGVIPMFPLAVLAGKVVGPNGTPIYLADVKYCTISTADGCESGSGGQNLGPGVTNSAGDYNGTVTGGWLPWATYIVVATAPGYSTDWTFGNASVGNTTTLPTLVLQPIGTNSTSSSSGGSSSSSSAAGVWVTGRLYNNQTGGVEVAPGGGLNFCYLGSIVCVPVDDGANSEGYFNVSLAPSLYFFNITVAGFVPLTIFVNASQAGFVNLGTIYLTADWWVSGQVVIDPWRSVTLSGGGGAAYGYGPAATVQGCDLGRTNCLAGVPTASNGSFNAPIPVTPSATLVISPSGTAYGGSVAGGFVLNTTAVHNLTSQNTTLTGPIAVIGMSIFGYISGRVWSNNTVNDSANRTYPAYGLPFASVSVLVSGNNTGQVTATTDGGGFWTVIVPGGNGNNTTHVAVSDAPAFTETSYTVKNPVESGAIPAFGGNSSLERFGWIQTTLLSSGTDLPIADAGATASWTDPRTFTYYSSSDPSNGGGFLNLTAPFGTHVQVNVSAPDFNATSFFVAEVNTSGTSFPNGSGVQNVGKYYLPADGWVIASVVNYTNGGGPPLTAFPPPVIRDPVNGLGVPGADVSVTSTSPTIAPGGSPPSNWNGQFYSDAPIGNADSVTVTHDGFLTNSTTHVVKSGSYTVFSSINLTGMAVVAGYLTATPGNAPIPDASVQVCGTVKNQQVCEDGYTNATGYFWIIAPPGALTVVVSQENFVASTSYATACSDCWIWAGHLNLSAYGYVSGTVRGLPSGFPVEFANASLCSTLGIPDGACGPGVATNQFGHFVVSAPPGSYILQVNDTNYNTSYLPVSLSPGEQTTVGTVFLSQFGTDSGRVVTQDDVPVQGAEVVACADFGQGSCTPTTETNGGGDYTFSAAPGPYTVTASVPGYQAGSAYATVEAGVTTQIVNIIVVSIGTNAQLAVSGVVTDSSTGSGLGGVTIAALAGNGTGGTIVSTAITRSNGSYQLYVPYGEYTFLAHENGWMPQYVYNVTVHVATTENFQLGTMTFPVSGVVQDGLTLAYLGNVYIAMDDNGVPGAQVGLSDASGGFTFALPNGTADLIAYVTPGGPGQAPTYADTYFSITVNGAPQLRNITMTPGISALRLTVVDALTGLPIVGASVSVVGTIESVKHYAQTFATGSDGAFAANLYAGDYAATASFAGYGTKQVDFTMNGSGRANVTIELRTTGTTGTSATSFSTVAVYGAFGVALAAILAAAFLAGRGPGGA